ncbi:MAG: HAD family hydrolase [Nanoarchaeota archaeon]|nr:HAD family hydrolase [Nanoarchaeota archaeon]
MKVIVFDYDGVLMDTFGLLMNIYKDTSREFNLNLPDDEEYYRELIELDWMRTLRKLNLTSKEDMEKQNQIFRKGIVKYGEGVSPYPGIWKMLDILSKDHLLGIATNNIRDEVIPRLEKHNLRKYFKHIFTSEDGKKKPDPDLLIKCLGAFGAIASDSAYVGDMDGDIACGKAAGIGRMVAVTYGYHRKHRLLDADEIAHSPEELLEKLTKK